MAEVQPVKPAWKTTEFWGKTILQVIVILSGIQGVVSPKWATLIAATLEILYGIQRALIKQPAITTIIEGKG